MANNFVIRKGLVVSGSNLQPLEIQGTTGQLFNVASSSKSNVFSVNNISGTPIFRVSGSEVNIGLANYSGSRAITFAVVPLGYQNSTPYSSAQITASALLTSLTIDQIVDVTEFDDPNAYYNYGAGTMYLGTDNQIYYNTLGTTRQGYNTTASGYASHAEGDRTIASYAHAEGSRTMALGNSSHAEGSGSIASGSSSHAEGQLTSASGDFSHTEGLGTIASSLYQHVQGQYNITSSARAAFIHGNGLSSTSKRNLIFAYRSGSDGVVEISGSLLVNGSITGSYATAMSPQTISTKTLINLDSGQEFLFKSDCDVTLPSSLQSGFSVTMTTLDTVAYLLTGSGVTLINNKGTTIPMKSSATIVNTGTANEYLVLGDL